jgi:hypothetical protein
VTIIGHVAEASGGKLLQVAFRAVGEAGAALGATLAVIAPWRV